MHCQCFNTATAATVSAPRPPRLRVYHSSALHGTSQSSAHHLMAALLQVYHSYQSASHLLPCATQPCLAPSALISLIIFQGWAGPLAASVAGSQSHDTGVLDRPFFYLFMPPPPLPYPVHPAPRPPALLRVYRSYQSVKLASALRDTDLFMISSLSYNNNNICFSGFSSSLHTYNRYIHGRRVVSPRASPPSSYHSPKSQSLVVRCTCALGGSSFSNVFKYINVL